MPTTIIECHHCKQPFSRINGAYNRNKRRKDKTMFCSNRCHRAHRLANKKQQMVTCMQCSVCFAKSDSDIKRSSKHFCSRSCAAIYNNTHKTKGTRRSKLEKWLEQGLTTMYPAFGIHFNRKDAIDAELDIYIPSMKLAFELNGIFHYEPVYGYWKMYSIQDNDQRKFQACAERGISLCVIDTSQQKYFKEATAMRYLDIITKLITQHNESSR